MQHRINYTAGFGIQTGNYEEFRDASNNVMRRLHYINSPYGLVAVVEKTPSSQYNTRYITTDYLGSIVCITDDAGNVLQQVSFDAWGRRRNPQTWALYQANAPLTPTPSALYFDRGYTGHEHLEKFDLINMNGRMYDPTLCRMLSVDNYNNNVSSTIGMNRYAYVGNNPLKYYEEDGHIWHIVIGAVVGGVVNWAVHGAQFNAKGLGFFGVGAAAGALAAGVGGGIASVVGGAGFGAGFVGTSTAAGTGFASGFVTGTGAGFAGGFVTGFGNSIIENKNIGQMLQAGLHDGTIGAVVGGVLGGVTGGIDAVIHDRNFWTGAEKQNVIVKINRIGDASLNALNDNKVGYSEVNGSYDTQVVEGEYIKINTNSDGNFVATIKASSNVDRLTGVEVPSNNSLIGNTIIKQELHGTTYRFESLERISSVKIYGYRYLSNPVSSFRDLFYSRTIIPFIQW